MIVLMGWIYFLFLLDVFHTFLGYSGTYLDPT